MPLHHQENPPRREEQALQYSSYAVKKKNQANLSDTRDTGHKIQFGHRIRFGHMIFGHKIRFGQGHALGVGAMYWRGHNTVYVASRYAPLNRRQSDTYRMMWRCSGPSQLGHSFPLQAKHSAGNDKLKNDSKRRILTGH